MTAVEMAHHFRIHMEGSLPAQKNTEAPAAAKEAVEDMSSEINPKARLMTERALSPQTCAMDAPQCTVASGSCCYIDLRRSRSLERFAEDRMETLVALAHSMDDRHESGFEASVPERES